MEMGYPEHPNDHDNNVLGPPGGTNVILDDDLDMNNDSGDDEQNAYDGYHPLGVLDDDTSDMEHADTIEANDDDDDDDYRTINDSNPPEVGAFPTTTFDSELERELWSAPRSELTNIHLDETRTAQIMSLMTQINLPEHSIPDWAREVSDDKWKEELLDRIRQRKNS